jgi:Fic family protein
MDRLDVAVLATRRLYTVSKTTGEATMFGDKQDKQQRLEQMAQVIERRPGISQAELARAMNMPRSTVKRDLPTLEKAGVLLSEDARGRLALFGRRQ